MQWQCWNKQLCRPDAMWCRQMVLLHISSSNTLNLPPSTRSPQASLVQSPRQKKPHTDKTRGRSKSSQESGSSYVGRRSASRDGKQSNRFSCRSASRTSQSSKRGDQQNKSKGKGNGKAKGRGKNAKKAVRVQTPAPQTQLTMTRTAKSGQENSFEKAEFLE